MLTSTFQLVRGLGPLRERRLWRNGIACWADLPDAPTVALPAAADARLRVAVDQAASALRARDCQRLAALLPDSEHWRLFHEFGEDAAYLDIETGDDDWGRAFISAIGIWDSDGPHLLLAGRDLDRFVTLAARWSMLVTF